MSFSDTLMKCLVVLFYRFGVIRRELVVLVVLAV